MSPGTTPPEPRPFLLSALVFVVGAASLGAEIAAARLLTPYFGASTIVWANTIGVVLVALSVGYWFGGRFADRHPHMRGLCLLVLVAAMLIALVPFASRPFLGFSVDAFDSVSIGGFAGSLFGVLVLVAAPVTLLGAAAPWAVRLAAPQASNSGEVVGRLYATSTAGSLIGTMLAALLLIPPAGDPAHLPCLRPGPGARRDRRARPVLRGCPGRPCLGDHPAARHDQGCRHRARPLRGRDRLRVRQGGRTPRRGAGAGAERGPGGALSL